MYETAGGSDRSLITVLGCGSASGCALPPYTEYKGVYIKKEWTVKGLAGACYGASESGWMDGSRFLSWFKKLFVPAVHESFSEDRPSSSLCRWSPLTHHIRFD